MERPIRYVREFLNDLDLDEQRGRWLERANDRLHGTTKAVPRLRFEQEEKHLLLPPADRPYHPLVLLPPKPAAQRRVALPQVLVERRPLAAYAALAGCVR